MNLSLLRRFSLGLALFWSVGLTAFAQATSLGTQLDAVVRLPGNVLVGVSPTGALVRSVNNGTSFTQVRAADSPRALLTLALSNSVIIAAGDAGNFVRSTDGGVTWSTLKAATSPSFVGKIQGIAGNGGTTWVAVGTGTTNNKITPIYSTDSGLTWQDSPQIASPVGELRGLTWSGTTWVAVGGNTGGGFVLRTTNPANAWSLATLPPLDPVLYTQTQIAPLNAVASNGGGLVFAAGDAGTVVYSTDHGATFSDAGTGLVSDNLLSVIYVLGTQWATGGAQGVVLQYDSVAAEPLSVAQAPFAEGTAITALVSGSTPGSYFFATAQGVAPVVHDISATVSVASNQLRVQLVGALTGFTYHIQQSSTLASWAAVPGSAQTYGGGTALFWDYPLPAAGEKIFYRVVLGALPN
jgi:photosystem II stability/assembly factor-like uncharacterized protein